MTSSSTSNPAEVESTLNQTLLDQYRNRKSGLLERLIAAYLEEAPRFFQNVRKSAEAGQFAEVKLNAHALKSCSFNLGATRLSKICQAIENAAAAEKEDEVRQLLADMGPECFEAEEALKTELFALRKQSSALGANVA
jgi:HPt (histidine-containing phosphotransfer) domain-containing protein